MSTIFPRKLFEIMFPPLTQWLGSTNWTPRTSTIMLSSNTYAAFQLILNFLPPQGGSLTSELSIIFQYHVTSLLTPCYTGLFFLPLSSHSLECQILHLTALSPLTMLGISSGQTSFLPIREFIWSLSGQYRTIKLIT